jgi:hypothetical protein
MTRTVVARFILLTLVAAAWWASDADAQQRSTSRWVAPRTADGQPDLQGNWSNATLTQIVVRRTRRPRALPTRARFRG